MAESVVVFEQDPTVARSLAGRLRSQFSVHLIHSRNQVKLREKLRERRPQALVVNIEQWRLSDVESLHRDFPGLLIVCTHRIPDEEMWMAALDAGAADVCATDDVEKVVTSIRRNMALSRRAAA